MVGDKITKKQLGKNRGILKHSRAFIETNIQVRLGGKIFVNMYVNMCVSIHVNMYVSIHVNIHVNCL
jgi:hypothetical protein